MSYPEIYGIITPIDFNQIIFRIHLAYLDCLIKSNGPEKD